MDEIIYTEEKDFKIDEPLNLYNDVGWTVYTNKPEELQKALQQSLCVITARCKGELVGLIRVVGDGVTIIFIQDILVLKTFQRKKIGTELMHLLLKKYKKLRQKCLMTDDTIKTRTFYESLGFTACDDGKTIAFYRDDSMQEDVH